MNLRGHLGGLACLLVVGLAACTSGGDDSTNVGGGSGGSVGGGSGGGGPGGGGPGGGGPGGGGGGPGCNDSCEAEGEAECRQPGYRTCERSLEGCLEWGRVEACDPGQACVMGQCAACANDCEPGSVRCGDGGGLQTCVADEDADPCYEWAVEADCPAGESCSANACRPDDECVNECNAEDDQQCAGAGFQVCVPGDNGCLRWGPEAACADGESCSLGQCRPDAECIEECEANARQCEGDGYQTCGNYDDDACNEWSAVVLCEGEEVCSNGECAGQCADECGPNGARQCGGNSVQTCGNFDRDECLEWGGDIECDAGQACSNGQCRAGCVSECDEGSTQCDGNGVQTCGNFDDDECMEWGAAVPCDEGESCSNGACADQCANECDVQNARRCGPGGVQTCGNHDEDNCLEWSLGMACGGDRVCANGECAAQCTDECAPGSFQCGGNGVQRCDNFDEDNCLEWSAGTACAEGEVCSLGRCARGCEDECRLGQERCAPGGLQRCANVDADECAEWAPATPCPMGQSCSNGACAAECIDECPAESRRCVANGFETCGNFDGDACLEWSSAALCPAGQACSNGQCAANCNDECAEGTVRCAGNGFQACGQHDGDRCLEWSSITACQDGTSCSSGACGRFCSDECERGAVRCGGGGVETCGDFDADPCADWGAAVACPMGQVCANGQCAARCVDECPMEGFDCDGASVRACGQFDQDPCREWSLGFPCLPGQICVGAECVAAPDEDCASDDDCPEGLACINARCRVPRGCMSDDDCAPGEACAANACVSQGDSGVGSACGDDGDCPEGMFCLDAMAGGYCSPQCDVDVPCPNGSTCYVLGAEGNMFNLCLSDCATGADCRDVQACYPSGGPLGGACYLAQCNVDEDCAGDPLVETLCQEGLCVQTNACDLMTGEGCAAGEQCFEQNGVGICIQLCDAFAGGNVCPAGEQCIDGGLDAPGNCVPAGRGRLNDPCTAQLDCGAGLRCIDDGVGNTRCLQICDTERGMAACGAGVNCVSTGGRAGVCIAPCQAECNANAARCNERGQLQTCGQFDEDLCLEWSPAAACPAGQSCNEFAEGCTAPCRANDECSVPLVPGVCQMGRCLIQSQCVPGGMEMPCMGADQCFAVNSEGNKGVCLEPCDPFGAACSLGAERCATFSSGSYCTPPGQAGTFEPCGSSADCQAGGVCLQAADEQTYCFEVCDVQAPGCPADQACIDLEIDGRFGVCN